VSRRIDEKFDITHCYPKCVAKAMLRGLQGERNLLSHLLVARLQHLFSKIFSGAVFIQRTDDWKGTKAGGILPLLAKRNAGSTSTKTNPIQRRMQY
jgi:hypothetical protein